jgi:hypothetical protein
MHHPIQGGHTRGKWHDYGEWNRHAARATTEVELATWSRWPGCGIGIVGGAVAALDIDIREDAELALRIEQLARQRLGDTPALRICGGDKSTELSPRSADKGGNGGGKLSTIQRTGQRTEGVIP